MSATDNVAEVDENVELPDVSDDFFNEFEDVKFLDEIVETAVPEESRLIRTDSVEENSTETTTSKNDEPNDEEPILSRCLEEINNLTRSIERRKRRLREELNESSKRKERRSRSPNRKSPSSNRNVRSRDRRLSPRRSPSGPRREWSKGRSRGRSRSRSRERNRSRDRRLSRNRRDRSRSVTPVTQPRGMSFLDELAQKFAEKGLDFPEKDLLRANINGTSGANQYQVAVRYPQHEVPLGMPPYIPMPMPMYNQPYQPQWNGNYMIEPLHNIPQPIQQIIHPLPFVHNTGSNMIPNTAKASKLILCFKFNMDRTLDTL